MDITEYDEFYKWYKANERRFHCSQMTEVQIAYSAYLHGIEQSHKHGVVQAEGSGGYKEHGHGYSAKDKLDTTNPPRQSAVGATVGQRSVGTNAEARVNCAEGKHFWSMNKGIQECLFCPARREAPSGGHL